MWSRHVLLLFATVVPIFGTALSADEPSFERITVQDGLAHSTVWDVHLDSLGFLWIATETHLQRYDGYEFELFEHDPEDPDSLSESEVILISEDLEGSLWFATRSGALNRYDRSAERFARFLPDADAPERLIPALPSGFAADDDGAVWLATWEGLNRLDPRTGRVTRFLHDPEKPTSLSHDELHGLVIDGSGSLWVGTFGGLDRLDPQEKSRATSGDVSFVHYRHDPLDSESLSLDVVASLFRDVDRDELWVGTADGTLHQYDRQRDVFLRRTRVAPIPLSFHRDRHGALWTGHLRDGLSRFDPATGVVNRYQHDPSRPQSLSSNEIFGLREDDAGILWVATRSGLSKLDPRRQPFETHRFHPSSAGGLASDSVEAVVEDPDGVLWVGTSGGITALDRGRNRIEHHRPDLSMLALLVDRHDTVWAGSSTGLARLERGTRQFISEPALSTSVRSLLEDSDGNLWLGTSDGLLRFDRNSGEFDHHTPAPGDNRLEVVQSILEDPQGDLWLATQGGLLRCRRDEMARTPAVSGSLATYCRHILLDPGAPDSALGEAVIALHRDAANVFWIGTYRRGLIRWDIDRPHSESDTAAWRRYRQTDGLANDRVTAISSDANGTLWVSTNGGLSRFDPRTETFRNYGTADGLASDLFYMNAAFRSSRGELLFGGYGGLTAFFPEQIEIDDEAPRVVLTELLLDGEPALLRRLDASSPLEKSLTGTRELILDHRHRTFSIEFAALHFSNPLQNRYAYRLEGYDPEWIPTGADRRFAHYTNLDPAEYVFRVKAASPGGHWNEEGATLRIIIRPPPWRTWWAFTIYGLVLAGLVFSYLRWQHKRLQREQERASRERRIAERERAVSHNLRAVDKLKDEFLANTSHELRTPLYGMTGLAESLIDGARGELPTEVNADLSMIVASGRRLATLVNDVLDFSKLEHGKLELSRRPVDLRPIAELVLALSRSLDGARNLEFHNEIPEELPPADADENRLVQIFHNLVGNAVKFTPSGSIEVSATARDDHLVVRVTDTGIGISHEKQARIFDAFEQADASTERAYGGTGLGLAVTHRLVELHGGKIWVESEPEKGSSFFFTLAIAHGASDAKSRQTTAAPLVEIETEIAVAAPRQATHQESQDHDAPHILIVDDEPINRQILMNQLASHGYRLSQAASGMEALERLAEPDIDLVLLDVMMPQMSGYEVCKTLRERFSLEELPVIFLTAKNQISDLVIGLAAGANDYLPKPIDKSELLARVKTHLDLLAVHRQLADMVDERTTQLAEREQLLSDREKLIGELEERNAELARFNYTVSHDLKNPLVTITNFLGLVRRDAAEGNSERLEHDLDRLEIAASQLDRLLEDLLEYSSVGVRDHSPEIVSVGGLAHQAIEELSDLLSERNVEVVVKTNLPKVRAGRQRLLELLEHLLHNATVYMGDQEMPRIEIGTREENAETEEVVFTISDNGMGIDPRYHDQVFGLFERLTPDEHPGTGIGLALVKRIVEFHGGRIWVESAGSGHGSTFCFTLPLGLPD